VQPDSAIRLATAVKDEVFKSHPCAASAVEFATPYVLADASGHVGLIREVLVTIGNQFRNSNHVSKADVVSFYFGPLAVSGVFIRFFAVQQVPQAEELVLRQVIVARCSEADRVPYDELNAAHVHLVRSGVLAVIGQIHLDFATEFHFRYLSRVAYFPRQAIVRPSKDGIDAWLLTVLSSFEKSVLQNKEVHAASSLPKEGVLQQQFYRGAALHLDMTSHISSEISRRYHDNSVVVAEIHKSDTGATGLFFLLSPVASAHVID